MRSAAASLSGVTSTRCRPSHRRPRDSYCPRSFQAVARGRPDGSSDQDSQFESNGNLFRLEDTTDDRQAVPRDHYLSSRAIDKQHPPVAVDDDDAARQAVQGVGRRAVPRLVVPRRS